MTSTRATRSGARLTQLIVGGTAVALLLGACSSGGSDKAASTTTSTTKKAAPLEILVSNDDGYSADGIDTLVEALRVIPDVKVTVVAPATNKSGTGSNVTPGTLTATQSTTKSGYPATAVNGFPADSVNYALDTVYKTPPQVVMTGINDGQNLGGIRPASGTVGAAKAAAARGLPAFAASQESGEPADYPTAAKIVVAWIKAHAAQLRAKKIPAQVLNLNVPTCAAGTKMRGVKQVPAADTTEGAVATPSNCASTVTAVDNDIAAFLNGFAPVSQLEPDLANSPTTTTFPANS